MTLLSEISDEAIDLAVRCTKASREITGIPAVALATKLRGDPDNEYQLEWTEEAQVKSLFLVVSALHMEALRRSGMLDIISVPPDPWSAGAVFEYRFTGTRRRHVRRLNAWGIMEFFLPEAWRCPSDYAISDDADRRMERLMSRRKQTTWPWSGASLFPSGPANRHVC